MNLVLQWHGPFSAVEGTSTPYLFDSSVEEASLPGVYLWTVNCEGVDLVHYVGKTDRTFSTRLWEELRSPRKRGHDWIADPESLRQGRKKWLYKPHGVRKPHLEEWAKSEDYYLECWGHYLRMLRIFIAPVASKKERKDTETALMWAVWDHEDTMQWPESQEDYFLTNGRPIPKRLSYPFKITMQSHETIRGLASELSGD